MHFPGLANLLTVQWIAVSQAMAAQGSSSERQKAGSRDVVQRLRASRTSGEPGAGQGEGFLSCKGIFLAALLPGGRHAWLFGLTRQRKGQRMAGEDAAALPGTAGARPPFPRLGPGKPWPPWGSTGPSARRLWEALQTLTTHAGEAWGCTAPGTDGRTTQPARRCPAVAGRGPRWPPRRRLRLPRPSRSAGGALPGRAATGGKPAHRARALASPAGSGSGRRQAREPEPSSAVRCCRCASPPAWWRPRRFPRCRRSSRASSTICEPRRSWTSASRWWRTTVSEAAAAPPRPAGPRAHRRARPGPACRVPPCPAPAPRGWGRRRPRPPATSRCAGRSGRLPLSAWLGWVVRSARRL